MNKISSFINRHVVLIVSLLIYVCCYVLLNSRGPLVDNDTIEYVGFAKVLAEGSFPTSPYYQPGVGLLVFIFKNLFFTDYLTAFRILNFTAGFGLVLVLQRLLILAFNTHKYTAVLIAAMPVIIYLSSLLYADIVFNFFAFSSLLFLVRAKDDQDNSSNIWIASLLAAASIFMKYNGLAVWVSGMLFIGVQGLRVGNFRKFILKFGLIFSFFPMAYVCFWKVYNGKLGLVEFTDYLEPVSTECIVHYLKHNSLSLYRLFTDRVFIGLSTVVNHLILWSLFIFTFTWIFLKIRIQIKSIVNLIFKTPTLLLILLFSLIYMTAVTVMHSLNCVTEPCVRLYSASFIGIGFFTLSIIIQYFNTKTGVIVAISVILSYLAAINYRVFVETKDIAINTDIKQFNNIVDFLKLQTSKSKVFGFATTRLNRFYWALNGKFNAFGVFPYQRHHDKGHDFYFDDTTYLNKIHNHASSMQPKEYIILELENSFIRNEIPKIKNLKIVFKQDNVYVFQK